ncbi:MAG: insulinase family protein [Pseudomonadales bacterium]|nr:insulinase family protein [Pseudomonadales bacterium]
MPIIAPFHSNGRTVNHSRIPLFLVLALTLTACTSNPDAIPQATSATIEVRKSPNDTREYRYLVLENRLRVLLVSDPATDKAAASLTVQRGSNHDPADFPGLAHFLEHMLFLGTEKYPEVDGYQKFIDAHGGSTNAYTAADHTNYFFDVQVEHFPAAMDRFAQFFIAPAFDPAYVDRERNAVDSEYQLQRKDDGWRGWAALKAVMNPDYAGARFNIGSLETLSGEIDAALATFFHDNYSADQMILVALGAESLDTLEGWIKPMFTAIADRRIGPAPVPEPVFTDEQLPGVLTYQTLKAQHSVSYNFPIPATEAYYRTKPADYLTNLLGHEGEGSLHQSLKARGLIESLAAGTNRFDDRNAFLSINIELTEEGWNDIPAITEALFGYIALLNREEPEAWRYDEQARVAELGFRFQEATSATGFVYRTGPALALYPPEDVLIAPYLMSGFDGPLIKRYLSYLTPENLLMEVSGADVETDRLERFFEVPYRLERRPARMGKVNQRGLHLPEPNPFLPERLELLPPDDLGPILAVSQPEQSNLDLWLDLDVEFGTPRANQYFTLGVRNGLNGARDFAMAQMYQRLVVDTLNRYTYPAYLAGLGYQLSVDAAGFTLNLSGYSDKQASLLDAVLEALTGTAVDPGKFELYKAELIREWRNFRNERPYSQTFSALNNLMLSDSFAPDQLADTLAGIGADDLEAWRQSRLARFAVVGIAHGNMDTSAVQQIGEHLSRHLPLADFPVQRARLTRIDRNWLQEVPIDHNDASIALYVQDPEPGYPHRARSALAGQLLGQAYFSELRTEQQLGYVVNLSNRTFKDQGGLAFIIQSPVASSAHLEAATRTFMKEQIGALGALAQSDFDQHKAALISRLTERDKNLGERSRRYWAELSADVTTFDSQLRIAELIGTLSKQDMIEYLQGVIGRLDSARVLVFNRGHFEEVPTRGVPVPAGGIPLTTQATSSR